VKFTKATDKIVEVVKYIFDRHVVIHYNITNIVSGKLLTNVMVPLFHARYLKYVLVEKVCFRLIF
jgi:hypothetical protein